MDIEQLKLILETLSAVSGDAQLIAVAWISINSISSLIVFTMIFNVAIRVIKLFRDQNEALKHAEKLECQLLQIKNITYDKYSKHYSSGDFEQILQGIGKLLDK